MLFFAIVYTVEGVGQVKAGVMWQPLTHYLKDTQNWDRCRSRPRSQFWTCHGW